MSLQSLYALIASRPSPADRPVMTPRGPGWLWQVGATRVGVVLPPKTKDGKEYVVFFDPSEVTPMET
jgi:hypothetical protein